MEEPQNLEESDKTDEVTDRQNLRSLPFDSNEKKFDYLLSKVDTYHNLWCEHLFDQLVFKDFHEFYIMMRHDQVYFFRYILPVKQLTNVCKRKGNEWRWSSTKISL